MKLPFQPYQQIWKDQFEGIKKQLSDVLQPLKPRIEHIGSTAVEGLSAKPIIDIQLGLHSEADLNRVPELLRLPHVVYYQEYNRDWPGRRFFVFLKQPALQFGIPNVVEVDEEIPEILHDHGLRLAQVHAFVKGTADWVRHIAFRDYLKAHPEIRSAYQKLKEQLVQQDWKDGNDYNKEKDQFLKTQQQLALAWYGDELNRNGRMEKVK
ncbi:GrpB family protein [Sphingobacterium thalpophilum]|uniref:GrpB family protein n=1 Tax=Sphingobacterium thalpophilum TaxID=259 RepID=UPI0024A68905|nr:GrpB family protein [Sphingobacterium thalpophilum]